MKQINGYKFGLLALALLMAIGVQAGTEKTKSFHEEYSVDANALVDISNKYGKVHIGTWDQNKVVIDVVVKVEATSDDKAQKILDRINIEFGSSSSMVQATTIVEKTKVNSNQQLKIDYTITMPSSARLDLTNRFGDVFITEINGTTHLNLSYGNLDVKALNNVASTLDLAFSEGNIGTFVGRNVELAYSELKINKASDLSIDSQFSELEVGEAKDVTDDSQYDDHKFGTVTSYNGDCQFTDVHIDQLSGRLILDGQYGELSVDKIEAGFSKVNIDNQFGEIDLGFASGSSFELDADVSFGDLDYPKSGTVKKTKDGATSNSYTGTVGSGTGSGTVTIDTSYGDISLEFVN